MAPKGEEPTKEEAFDPDEYMDYLKIKQMQKEGGAGASSGARGGVCPGGQNGIMLILLVIISICAILMVAELGSVISFASHSSQPAPVIINNGDSSGSIPTSSSVKSVSGGEESQHVPNELPPTNNVGENVCEGKNPKVPNAQCIVDAVVNVGPQAGANVTKGYKGDLVVDYKPILTPYWQNGMCPVNVHWHLGTEHYSLGQYDETGTGPKIEGGSTDGQEESGFQCKLYDATDVKFTRPYEFKHCIGMQVGQTYEVHWPHSAAGACNTPNQYQTPFYDGVFCRDDILTDTAQQVGVQSQVFVIVNDESYFYPDLFRGMIVDGEMGQDIAKYTGSSTGSARSNTVCSPYSPITWHVDRKCHLISASTFDKMCADMKTQRDDMSDDLHPHGSRALVSDNLVANNQNDRRGRLLRASE